MRGAEMKSLAGINGMDRFFGDEFSDTSRGRGELTWTGGIEGVADLGE
jgi:hypothetical protein